MRNIRSAVAVIAFGLAVLAGCSGGSVVPSSGAFGGGADSGLAAGSKYTRAGLTVAVRFPKHKRHHRHARYVSPSTNSVTFNLTTVNGVAPPAGFTLNVTLTLSSNCSPVSGSGYICSTQWTVPAADDKFTITAFDSSSRRLSENVVTKEVAPGNQTMSTTLTGVPASIVISPAASTDGNTYSVSGAGGLTVLGAATPFPFTVTMKDADGNVIVGPGTPSYTLAINPANFTASAITNAGFDLKPKAATLSENATVTLTAVMPAGVAACTPGCQTAPKVTTALPGAVVVSDGNAESVYAPAVVAKALAGNTAVAATANLTGGNADLGVAFDNASPPNLFIANSGTRTVNCYTAANVTAAVGGTSKTKTQSMTIATSGTITPTGLLFDSSGDLFVAEEGSNTVGIYSSAQTSGCLTAAQGAPAATLALSPGGTHPTALAFDAAGNLWVAEASGHVDVFTGSGTNWTRKGYLSSSPYSVLVPSSLIVDPSGNLFVVAGASVAAFSAAQLTSAIGGTLGVASTGTLTPAAATPDAIAEDAAGDLFIAGSGGGVTVYPGPVSASTIGVPGTDLTAATTPEGVVFDAALSSVFGQGTLYVANAGSKTLSVYWSATVAGALAGTAGIPDGSLKAASAPVSVRLVPAGDI